MGLSDSRRPNNRGYAFPRSPQGTTFRPTGLPGSRPIFLHAPSPNTPGSHAAANVGFFTACTGFTISGRMATPIEVTRPNRVHFHYGSWIRPPELRLRRYQSQPSGFLHIQPTIYMVSSFQLTRSAKLSLAHQKLELVTNKQSVLPSTARLLPSPEKKSCKSFTFGISTHLILIFVETLALHTNIGLIVLHIPSFICLKNISITERCNRISE